MEEVPQDGKLNIELSEEIADGEYSNLVIISHSNSEFVFDFVYLGYQEEGISIFHQ